jgi:exodeoxyribonuclease-5
LVFRPYPPPDLRQFDEFAFGYALTAQKAQGSQWADIYLFDESYVFREEAAHWRHIGEPRAVKQITVVS